MTELAPKAERQSQVVEQMDRLTGNTNALESESLAFVDRIKTLLKEDHSMKEEGDPNKKDKVERGLVPHADNLRAINRRLNRVVITLTYALERLEL